jgi:hypothetical protein
VAGVGFNLLPATLFLWVLPHPPTRRSELTASTTHLALPLGLGGRAQEAPLLLLPDGRGVPAVPVAGPDLGFGGVIVFINKGTESLSESVLV